jgi:cold shock CspA family protein
MGRITCEQKGECFFLTFLKEDVEDEKDGLRQGDEVSFFVSTHKRTGAVRAVQIILLRHCEEKKAQGIVASLKDSFGFIERADEASEIFFHHSEVDGGIEILRVGSHVEFVIQDRHGKPVATNVVKLQPGTVKLEVNVYLTMRQTYEACSPLSVGSL